MNPEQLLYSSIGISVLLILSNLWLWYRLNKLDHIRKEFYSSGLDKNLEQVLVDQNRKLNALTDDTEALAKTQIKHAATNRLNIQKLGFIRFNPFDDAGGNISFALALLNDHNNGVVLSSLHGREGTRVYAKEIKNNKSTSKLTEEEQQAINQAN